MALACGTMAGESRAGMITAVDAFRFIRADAVIDADGDGAAEVWDVKSAGPPSLFGDWDANVSARADFAIDGIGAGTASASASQTSTFDLFGDHAVIQASGSLVSSVSLSGAARDNGTSSGFPRFSGPFVNYWFDFDLDDTFEFVVDGSSSSLWSLQDRMTFSAIASFVDGTSVAGVIGPGSYRLRSTISTRGNSVVDYDFTMSLREATSSSVPEPGSLVLFSLGGFGCLVVRRRSARAQSRRPEIP